MPGWMTPAVIATAVNRVLDDRVTAPDPAIEIIRVSDGNAPSIPEMEG